MTPEEIKQLAVDTFKSNVFFSTMLQERDEHLLSSIFMPMIFMDEKQIKQLETDKVVAFYEYYDKASSRSINGYPMFMSMRTITKEDLEKVHKIVEELQGKVNEL